MMAPNSIQDFPSGDAGNLWLPEGSPPGDPKRGSLGSLVRWFAALVPILRTLVSESDITYTNGSRVLVTDASGNAEESGITTTELNYLDNLDFNVATAFDKTRVIRIEDFKTGIGVSAPSEAERAVGASGTLYIHTLQFDKNTQDDIYFAFHVPEDADPTQTATIRIMWVPGAGWTTGNYVWKLEYLPKALGENLDEGTPTTDTADVTPTDAETLLETSLNSITFEQDDDIFCHLYRDVANDNGDDSGDLIAVEFVYTSNKFGT